MLDREVDRLADSVSVYILERVGLNDAGGVKRAESVAVEHVGSDLERRLASAGIELTVPTFIRNYNDVVSNIAPDVIVAADFFRLSSWQALIYKWRHRDTRLVFLCETKRWPSRPLSRLVMRLMLWLSRLGDHLIEKIIVYGDDGRRFFAENWPAMPVTIVPPSVDTELFSPAIGRKFMRSGNLRILMNARFADYKRHTLLLEALKRLKSDGRKFTLTLIGRDESGKEVVRRLVAEARLETETEFLEPIPRDRLPALYADHDLLVLPSYNEAMGMVVPEAMASGLPTVTSDTVGANIYVVPGATGFIFKTDDVDDLTRALQRCFDVDLLESFGSLAREYIVRHHGASKSDRLLKALL